MNTSKEQTVPASALIARPYPIQMKGHVWAAWLLKLIGWRVDFQGLPTLQGVAILYPHTSNWDFCTAMLCKWTMGLPMFFWCKDSLLKIPLFGSWVRWIGGEPILNEITADEARAAGDKYGHGCKGSSRGRLLAACWVGA